MRRLPLLSSLLAVLACGSPEQASKAPEPTPEYVGAEVCASCHPDETERWRGSHHDLAMQEALPTNVLGDFDDRVFEHRGERFRFFRRGEAFFVETAGPGGAVQEFEIVYTFGAQPLQQHLVRFPGGRLQALGVAWDSRPATAGGQRWFHLHPEEAIPPGDLLHWTGPAGNWNSLCADCHSTNLEKGYRLEEDRFDTRWSELDVACEACHGRGAAHVAWANSGTDAGTRRGLEVPLGSERTWKFREGARIASRFPPTPANVHERVGGDGEIDVCAPCHSRRTRIAQAEPGSAFLDHARPALLEEDLYHADGQIQDEVYVWGSFVQSRMFAAGVTCSDCHDPHSLRLEEPDAVCAGCHRPEAFATPAHHRHEPRTEGASCVACHMPSRTYMVVDDRHDHGFRVPRPDVSEMIGAPDPCTSCHTDRSPGWASEAIAGWRGSAAKTATHPGAILHAGRRLLPGAAAGLTALADDRAKAPILRASALRLLGSQLDAESLPSLHAGLRDPSPLVRMAAASAAESLPPEERWLALESLLRDETRAVRIEAARALAPMRQAITDPRAAGPFDAALDEYREVQRLSAERPGSHVNLGLLNDQLGELDAARKSYETALRIGPWFLPGYVNLAEHQRTRGHEDESERLLRKAVSLFPENADVHHALGLLLARRQALEEALVSLELAAGLAPRNPRYAYVHGIALSSTGQLEEALAVLSGAHERHPGNLDLLFALATLHRDAGRPEAARSFAAKLLALRPDDPNAQALVRELK